MSRIRIGCQTITWGDDRNKTEPEVVLQDISRAGYEGVETGAHRLEFEGAGKFKKLLEANNLKLAALHTGIGKELFQEKN